MELNDSNRAATRSSTDVKNVSRKTTEASSPSSEINTYSTHITADARLSDRERFFRNVSRPSEEAKLRILSLGAGVQSTVLALMAARKIIFPAPHAAIFADTHWEEERLYRHLDWLESELQFPVIRVSAGDLAANVRDGVNTKSNRYVSVPFFTENGGMGRRQCTAEYKIKPVLNVCRQLLNVKERRRVPKDVIVEMWIGISTDELQRLKNARVRWVQHRWPLLEHDMNRNACIAWFKEHYPDKDLPRSACIGCPYKSNAEWRELQTRDPDAFSSVVDLDRLLRHGGDRFKRKQFVHRERKPLEKVDFRSSEDAGQLGMLQECDGVCGT